MTGYSWIFARDHPSTVGTQVPAKPSLRMHEELDPLPVGGRQGGIRMSESHIKCVKDSNKEPIGPFSQCVYISVKKPDMLYMRGMQLPLFNRTAFIDFTTVSYPPLSPIHLKMWKHLSVLNYELYKKTLKGSELLSMNLLCALTLMKVTEQRLSLHCTHAYCSAQNAELNQQRWDIYVYFVKILYALFPLSVLQLVKTDAKSTKQSTKLQVTAIENLCV